MVLSRKSCGCWHAGSNVGIDLSGPTNLNSAIFWRNKLIFNVFVCWDAAADKNPPILEQQN